MTKGLFNDNKNSLPTASITFKYITSTSNEAQEACLKLKDGDEQRNFAVHIKKGCGPDIFRYYGTTDSLVNQHFRHSLSNSSHELRQFRCWIQAICYMLIVTRTLSHIPMTKWQTLKYLVMNSFYFSFGGFNGAMIRLLALAVVKVCFACFIHHHDSWIIYLFCAFFWINSVLFLGYMRVRRAHFFSSPDYTLPCVGGRIIATLIRCNRI